MNKIINITKSDSNWFVALAIRKFNYIHWKLKYKYVAERVLC